MARRDVFFGAGKQPRDGYDGQFASYYVPKSFGTGGAQEQHPTFLGDLADKRPVGGFAAYQPDPRRAGPPGGVPGGLGGARTGVPPTVPSGPSSGPFYASHYSGGHSHRQGAAPGLVPPGVPHGPHPGAPRGGGPAHPYHSFQPTFIQPQAPRVGPGVGPGLSVHDPRHVPAPHTRPPPRQFPLPPDQPGTQRVPYGGGVFGPPGMGGLGSVGSARAAPGAHVGMPRHAGGATVPPSAATAAGSGSAGAAPGPRVGLSARRPPPGPAMPGSGRPTRVPGASTKLPPGSQPQASLGAIGSQRRFPLPKEAPPKSAPAPQPTPKAAAPRIVRRVTAAPRPVLPKVARLPDDEERRAYTLLGLVETLKQREAAAGGDAPAPAAGDGGSTEGSGAAPSNEFFRRLGLGMDLTNLGLNLNSSGFLHPNVSNVAGKNLEAEQFLTFMKPSFELPESYMKFPFKDSRFVERFHYETLFYIFYCFVQDEMQIFAAKELLRRHWLYHTKLKIWFQAHTIFEKKATFVKGHFYYFDPTSWRRLYRQGFRFDNEFEFRFKK